jgi:membrane-bound ClpP family serine protease
LNSDERAKATNASKAAIRDIVKPRGAEALALAESMIDEAKAATAQEALKAHLVDFVVDNVDDLLESELLQEQNTIAAAVNKSR